MTEPGDNTTKTANNGANGVAAVAARSPFRIGLRRLGRNRMAMAALAVLGALYAVALFADVIAPYGYASEVRDMAYAPPRLHCVDADGRFHWRPFVYKRWFTFDPVTNARVWHEDHSRRFPLAFFVRGEEHKLLWLIPTRVHLYGVGAPVATDLPRPTPKVRTDEWGMETTEHMPDLDKFPARVYFFGGDHFGRDLFSRLCYGARISMSIGLLGAGITFILGMLIGGISGYFGGAWDIALQRLCEMVMMIPGFYLILALRSALPMDLPSTQVYLMLVLILSFIGWAGFARVIRGLVLSIRTHEYVLAAEAMGVRRLPIIVRHVLPNTLSYAIISLTLSIPGYILGESGLSLIGLGIQEPQASWGNLLSNAMQIHQIRYHPWILLPGVLIFLAVIAFNTLGDGLRDAFDPQGLTRRSAP